MIGHSTGNNLSFLGGHDFVLLRNLRKLVGLSLRHDLLTKLICYKKFCIVKCIIRQIQITQSFLSSFDSSEPFTVKYTVKTILMFFESNAIT